MWQKFAKSIVVTRKASRRRDRCQFLNSIQEWDDTNSLLTEIHGPIIL